MEVRLLLAIEASKDAIEAETSVRPDFILTDDPGNGYYREVAKRRPHYRESVTAEEAVVLAARILPDLDRYASSYDVKKYPPADYQHVRERFQRPEDVTGKDVRLALMWKFGHIGKARIPGRHERLIEEIAECWPSVVQDLPLTPHDVFRQLEEKFGGPKRFITVACLTHLMFPNWVPLIDQHNFRSMNHHMNAVRPAWRSPRVPSIYEDIAVLDRFLTMVIEQWPASSAAPSRMILDRYLMMHGKTLKA